MNIAVSMADHDSPENKRRAPRRRALLSGKIAYHNGSFTIPCTIRDISDIGARVRIAEGQVLPTQVFLIDVREGCAYDSVTKWQSRPDAGLEFRQKIKLDSNCPEEYRYLRRILIDASPR